MFIGTLAMTFLLITYHLSLTTVVFAVPHINGKNPGPKEYVHQLPDVQTLRAMGISSQAIAKTVVTTGTRKIAVILVNFSEAGTNTSEYPTMSSTDITGFNTTFDYLKNFYKEASYGKLDLGFTFFYYGGSTSILSGTETPFLLTTPMSTYGVDTDQSLSQLVIDAISAANGAVKHSDYDGVIVAHAGYGNETTEKAGDIWAAYVGPFTSTFGFTEGTNVAAKELSASNTGVACHEFGHHIGLWDLYQTTGDGSSQVGCWSLMDCGVWLGSPSGSKPSHPSGWEKEKLGWLTPIEISSGTNNLTSYAFETSSTSVYKLKIPDTVTEYFIVYHTSKTAYSPSAPGNGLLIWHIDEGTIDGTTFVQRNTNNSLNNYSHRTVDVEEADSTDPSVNHGDSTDLWPGTRINFTPSYSNKYNGQPSMVNVLGVFNYTQYSSFSVSYKPFISGYVKDSAGNGISNVELYSTSGSTSMRISTTDSNGYFSFTDLDDWTYTITPSKIGYNFLPTSKDVVISGYYSNNNNFVGIVATTYSDLNSKPNNIKPVNNLFTPGDSDGKTTIYYKMEKDGTVTIKLYTLDGRFVKTLLDDDVVAGVGSVEWDGLNEDNSVVSSGIYLVQITAPGYREIKKICVIR
ncbi:MAG: M6 family metalloprotease domain-containing protein [Elusimicrobiota bacterium]